MSSSPPFAWNAEHRIKREVAHLTGFEPAFSSSQSWCFPGCTPIRSFVERRASMVMPWKAIESVGKGREVHF
jgi:hypothetical protein